MPGLRGGRSVAAMLRPRPVIAALCLVLAVPAAASAATVDDTGARLVVAAGDEVNHISITQMDTGPILVRDTGDLAPTGCPPFSHPDWPAGYLICLHGSPQVGLGGGDDSIGISDPGTWATIGESDVDGGEGNDSISAGAADDTFDGGPGNDTLRPYQGDDTVDGGPGEDDIDTSYGEDTIDARDGAGGDEVVCGEEEDTVQADVGDTVAADCEHVTRVGGETPPPVGEDKTPTTDPTPGGAPGPVPGTGTVPVPGTGTVPGTQQGGSTSSADTRAPVLTVTRKRLRGGKVRLTLRCDEACTVTAKAKRAKRTVALLAGKKRTITLRVRGRATVRLTAVDAAGNRSVTRR